MFLDVNLAILHGENFEMLDNTPNGLHAHPLQA